MKNNPFTSDIFTSIWSKHFLLNKPSLFLFSFIQGVRFFKSFGPLYINEGQHLTKGISYILHGNKSTDFKGKVALIYDVPSFFEVDTHIEQSSLKLHKVKQYPGFLIELKNHKDLSQYLSSNFSKSSRYKLNKYKKRLETCFDINYKMYHGDISLEKYNFVFENFKTLLEKRFSDKKITNNNLDTQEWAFYKEVAYPMILEKKASLFVIYDGEQIIGVTLNYFSDTVLFDAITVFDIDYSKFHLGSVTIMNLIAWGIENNYKILDFSKGYFDYKKQWGTQQYDFEYHIYYDPQSWRATLHAYGIKKYFALKQYLREKKINEKIHRLNFALKNKTKQSDQNLGTYSFIVPDRSYEKQELESVNFMNDNIDLKQMVFEFAYLNLEEIKDITLYKIIGASAYLISGKKIIQMMVPYKEMTK